MMLNIAKSLSQYYFFKICLAVTGIVSFLSFSALLTFIIIFYYQVDPLLPLMVLALLWLMMIGVMYGYYYFAKKKNVAELGRILNLYKRINILLAITAAIKNLFNKDSQ